MELVDGRFDELEDDHLSNFTKTQTCDAAIGIFQTGKNLSRNQWRCFILVRNTSQTRETDLNPHPQNFKILKNGGG